MSSRTVTTSESPSYSNPLTPESPIVGWGVVLIAFAIALGSQTLRKSRSAQRTTPKDPSYQSSFTQALQWLAYGKHLENAEDLEGAIAVYDQGLNQHPNDFRLWHERGLALAKHQQFEAALESYDRAYALRPDCRDLAHERGDALLQLGRYEAAIASLNRYLRYSPNNAHVLGDVGFAHYQLGQYDEALQFLTAAISNAYNDPNSADYARHYQIKALEQLGQLNQALQAAKIAMQQSTNPDFKAQYEALQAQIRVY
jgi:tetratricopeptide (TPR) repeat protein